MLDVIVYGRGRAIYLPSHWIICSRAARFPKALIFSAVPVAQEAVPWPESKSHWQ